jgi:hypothetical protein
VAISKYSYNVFDPCIERYRLLQPYFTLNQPTILVHSRDARLQEPFLPPLQEDEGDLLGGGQLDHVAIVCDRFRPSVVWTYKQLLPKRLKTQESRKSRMMLTVYRVTVDAIVIPYICNFNR